MKGKQKKTKAQIPPDVLEAIDEAAADLAAETNLTRAQARDAIVRRMEAKAQSASEAADEIEDEEDDEDENEDNGNKGKGKDKGKGKGKGKDEDEDDGDEDGDDDEDEDDRDERPPRSHWSDKPLFGKRT